MYEYVSKKQVKPYKKDCNIIFTKLQLKLKKEYKISVQVELVGSGEKNLVTRNGKGAFDLDYNLIFTHLPEKYDLNPKTLKDTIRRELDTLMHKKFSYGQDSRASITYLVFSQDNKCVEFNLDVALIKKSKDNNSAYRLIHDKKNDVFIWNEIFHTDNISEYKDEIIKANQWQLLRNTYLKLKNDHLANKDKDIISYSIYVEAVNLVYQKIKKEKSLMSKVSEKTHTQEQMNHHSNQCNPNNTAHKAANDNHSNQCNPNNSNYKVNGQK